MNPAGALALNLVLTPVLVGAASLAAIAVAVAVQGASLYAGRRLGLA